MEKLRYISTQFRKKIVEAYIKEFNVPVASDKEEADVEAFLFGDDFNRRLIDVAFDRADLEVDRDRYQQHSDEYFRDVVRELPQYRPTTVITSLDGPWTVDSSDDKVDQVNWNLPDLISVPLDKKQLIYIGAMIFLATRGGVMDHSDVARAFTVSSDIYKKFVESEK